jgi:hypothetical protein
LECSSPDLVIGSDGMSCKTSCGKGEFSGRLEDTGTCQKCEERCLSCEESADNCTECRDPEITPFVKNCPSCICKREEVTFRASEKNYCEGHPYIPCFSILLVKATDSQILSLPANNVTLGEKDYITLKNKTKPHQLLLREDGLQLILPRAKDKASTWYRHSKNPSITLVVDNGLLMTRNSTSYFLGGNPTIHNFTVKDEPNELAEEAGQLTAKIRASTSVYTAVGFEAMVTLSSLMGVQGGGYMISYVHLVRLLSEFRYMGVHHGDFYERVLDNAGKELDPESFLSPDDEIRNSHSSRGKFSEKNYPIALLSSSIWFRFVIYVFSWCVVKILKMKIRLFQNPETLSKLLYYTSVVVNRLHFSIFNMIVTKGTLVVVRTVLDLAPTSSWLWLQKYFGIFCSFLFCADFFDLFSWSLETPKGKSARRGELVRKQELGSPGSTARKARVEYDMLPESIAKVQGYELKTDASEATKALFYSPPMVDFSLETIKDTQLHTFSRNIPMRLEGFITRVRLVLYQILIVSLPLSPSVASAIILACEVTNLIVYLPLAIKHNYLRSRFYLASKINVGFAIIVMASISFGISLSGKKSGPSMWVQYFGIGTFLICNLIEFAITLCFTVSFVAHWWREYRNSKKNKKPIPEREKLFQRVWVLNTQTKLNQVSPFRKRQSAKKKTQKNLNMMNDFHKRQSGKKKSRNSSKMMKAFRMRRSGKKEVNHQQKNLRDGSANPSKTSQKLSILSRLRGSQWSLFQRLNPDHLKVNRTVMTKLPGKNQGGKFSG